MKTQHSIRLIAITLALTSLSSCSQWGVKPWERDLMAKKIMQPDANPLESAADEHTYFSKEASTGGAGFGGGGCGCN